MGPGVRLLILRVHQLPALDQFVFQQRHDRQPAAEADGAEFQEKQGQSPQREMPLLTSGRLTRETCTYAVLHQRSFKSWLHSP